MRVTLLDQVTVKEATTLTFADGQRLDVGPGSYYPCALGVVIDLAAWKCRATKTSQWKLEPPCRYG